MAKIGLFFGTQTGKTETVAEMIQKEFGGEAIVELHDISSASTEDFAPYDALIIGCPTWNYHHDPTWGYKVVPVVGVNISNRSSVVV